MPRKQPRSDHVRYYTHRTRHFRRGISSTTRRRIFLKGFLRDWKNTPIRGNAHHPALVSVETCDGQPLAAFSFGTNSQERGNAIKPILSYPIA